MVRVLSCHHFRGQKVSRCESAVGMALAEEAVLVALDNGHQVNVYCSDAILNLSQWFANKRNKMSFGRGSLGKPWEYEKRRSNPDEHKVEGRKESELKLSHYFEPVDFVQSIAYNQRGHYLVLLEKREGGTEGSSCRVRIYFQWDHIRKGKPMKARIAGLVSPTGGDFDNESLTMVEIPPEPLFAPIATASCQISGNLAVLAVDSRVNVYAFGLKEGSGRPRIQYADFDLAFSLQFIGFIPRDIAFGYNFLAALSPDQVSLVRFSSMDRIIETKGLEKGKPSPKKEADIGEAVFFNPKDDSVRVILPTIAKANRRKRQPNSFLTEEFQDEIRFNQTVILMAQGYRGKAIEVEDLLRLTAEGGNASKRLSTTVIYPLRTQKVIGGTLCLVSGEAETYIYYLPESRGSLVCRVCSCPFTAPLTHLFTDGAFFQAVTEVGLETYSSRGLYYALMDHEGFSPLNNDCPMKDESPTLLGIRPFVGVRFVAANDNFICLLSAPSPTNQSTTSSEVWTVYLLENPSVDLFYQDACRAAEVHKESSLYFHILAEIHLYLRGKVNMNPEIEPIIRTKYCDNARLLGLEYFRLWTKNPEDESLLDMGITFLNLGETDTRFFFRPDNQHLPRDPQLINGIAKFIRVSLPRSLGDDTLFPPSLTKAIVEFLSNNSPKDLVRVLIQCPWLRDLQGTRLLPTLRVLTAKEDYGWRESLSLILTLVSVQGKEVETREEIQLLIGRTDQVALQNHIHWPDILERKKNKLRLSDLAICFAMANTFIHTNVVGEALVHGDVGLEEVVSAFHQGVNLNADAEVKERVTGDMRILLENYFLLKIEVDGYSEEEVRALRLLVSSYLGIIQSELTKRNTTLIREDRKGRIFAQVPSFVDVLLQDTQFSSPRAKDNFYSLASLLVSPLGKKGIVGDLVLTLSKTLMNSNPPMSLCLCVLGENEEKGIGVLLDKKPELLLLYGKEIFGGSVGRWKSLVRKLKERISGNPKNQDILSAVIESVYLHLANSLSPSELEEVLEKEEGNERFLKASKRVDLANAFAEKVVQMSGVFLTRP